MIRISVALCLVGAVGLSSCGTARKAFSLNTPAGAGGLMTSDEAYGIDLITLLGGEPDAGPAAPRVDTQVARASRTFNAQAEGERNNPAALQGLILRRNAVQDHIIFAADERCRYWKNYFGTVSSSVGWGLGSASTGLASMGAAFTTASTVRGLAAAAGVVGAVRSEFDRAYLHNLSQQVIFQGIEQRRDKIRAAIYERRGDPTMAVMRVTGARAGTAAQAALAKAGDPDAGAKPEVAPPGTVASGGGNGTPASRATQAPAAAASDGFSRGKPAWTGREYEDLQVYTLQRAIADAVVYHSSCSVAAGLEEAAASLNERESPSLESIFEQSLKLERTLKALETARKETAAARAGTAEPGPETDPSAGGT